jgi:hypothetical protein
MAYLQFKPDREAQMEPKAEPVAIRPAFRMMAFFLMCFGLISFIGAISLRNFDMGLNAVWMILLMGWCGAGGREIPWSRYARHRNIDRSNGGKLRYL